MPGRLLLASYQSVIQVEKNRSITIGGRTIAPGERALVDLPSANLYTHTELKMPVHVVVGRQPGPTLFLTGAMHGDELNGVEIIKRVLQLTALKRLRGCLLAVPLVNVFGFINRSRYLPDRRDLNRSFPGNESGSLAARVAHVVATQIVAQSDYGIDLHTGAINRTNLPQIRADLADERSQQLALAFGAPVIIHAAQREGSLRKHAVANGVKTLVYESGEALRFDELSIRVGVTGIGRIMRAIGMLPERQRSAHPAADPLVARSTTWIRAPASGIFRTRCRLGDRIEKGQVLARVSDPFGEVEVEVPSPAAGL